MAIDIDQQSARSRGSAPSREVAPVSLLWLISAFSPTIFVAGMLGYALGGGWVWVWLGPVFMYAGAPMLEWLLGEDRRNPVRDAIPHAKASRVPGAWFYKGCVYMHIAWQFLANGMAIGLVHKHALPWFVYLPLILSVGAVNGIGVAASHELGHKANPLDGWLARLGMAPIFCYAHSIVSHNLGHHRHVATPLDHASARLGEGFWRFLPRDVVSGCALAWRVECRRLKHAGRPWWSYENDILKAYALSLGLYAALAMAFGGRVILFMLLQSIHAVATLEVVNYVEHYGLLRPRRADGSFAECLPEHSWDSSFIVGNLLLFNVARHSDHHAYPRRPYQLLRHHATSPQLPAGYATMTVVAMVPALWFLLMDKRVIEHYHGHLERANIYGPSKRRLERIFLHELPQ